jgi:hypothetical protein
LLPYGVMILIEGGLTINDYPEARPEYFTTIRNNRFIRGQRHDRCKKKILLFAFNPPRRSVLIIVWAKPYDKIPQLLVHLGDQYNPYN